MGPSCSFACYAHLGGKPNQTVGKPRAGVGDTAAESTPAKNFIASSEEETMASEWWVEYFSMGDCLFHAAHHLYRISDRCTRRTCPPGGERLRISPRPSQPPISRPFRRALRMRGRNTPALSSTSRLSAALHTEGLLSLAFNIIFSAMSRRRFFPRIRQFAPVSITGPASFDRTVDQPLAAASDEDYQSHGAHHLARASRGVFNQPMQPCQSPPARGSETAFTIALLLFIRPCCRAG